MRCYFIALIACFGFLSDAFAQQTVVINDSLDQHIFSYGEIQIFEDSTSKIPFSQISSKRFEQHFRPSRSSTPQAKNFNSTYWYRIKIRGGKNLKKEYILEFFDQTIDELTAYLPQGNGKYTVKALGDNYRFNQRQLHHKNFELTLDKTRNKDHVYYFKVKSRQIADIIIVLRSVDWFVHYALDEYFSFGIFYGMILVFSFYNLLMFFAIRQRQYLDFVLYVLAVGLYQMSADGIAYQYLWPNDPEWNQYAYGIALYFVSIFSLLFTRDLLHVKAKAPALYKLINGLIGLRTIIFLFSLLYKEWLNYKFLEFVPLLASFITGIYIFRKGYRPARFFVLGYGLLFLGFTIKLLIVLTNGWLNFGVISYYSLSFCFILEMVLLSFAIGDKVRILKVQKDKAQQRTIREMKENSRLKDILNKELESQVSERTKEVIEKSTIIEQQNEELKEVNKLLQQQAEEISRMNVLLEQDNIELQSNIENVTRARIMSADVDFTEFSKIYPDQEACFEFLADLKWKRGYTCRKCGNSHHYNGHLPHSKRCSKCGYEESVTANTIFQNTRIPINKAFYMIFLIYSTKGKISSHKLGEILDIRQSTCWTYSSKVKKIMDERKKDLKNAGNQGWSKLVLD
ncbi:7TM diverse intracellular signaling domain-containing protein [Rubrolithibacter danxiaensis]|uniref:7TM diverse intracellular signaling domain-containing protein n=1 Tax=Rubrolithibacter danxiaensis TaxID=3390805 RepID=UPI003BF832C1